MSEMNGNENKRNVPRIRWGRAWMAALALAVCALFACEWLLNAQGYNDDLNMTGAALWSRVRRQVRENYPKQVVLLGASRMQQDVNPRILARELGRGWRVAQLAVADSRELPLLRHFADDESFTGVAVFSCKPEHMTSEFRMEEGSPLRDRAEDFIEYYEQETVTRRWDGLLSDTVRRRISWPGSLDTGIIPAATRLLTGEKPPRSRYGRHGIKVYPSRWIAADYQSSWGEKRRKQKWNGFDSEDIITTADMEAYTATLSELVSLINARGGRVIIVRLPSSGYIREKERLLFPRKLTWDQPAEKVPASFIHFEDYPQLSRFTCGDASHLDYRDVPEFTRSLADVLRNILSEDCARR